MVLSCVLLAIVVELSVLVWLAAKSRTGQTALGDAEIDANASQQMAIEVREEEIALGDYLRTSDPSQLARVTDSRAAFTTALGNFSATLVTPDDARDRDELAALHDRMGATGRQLLDLQAREPRNEARRAQLWTEYVLIAQAIADGILHDRVQPRVLSRESSTHRDLASARDTAVAVTSSVAVSGIILVAVVGVWLHRRVGDVEREAEQWQRIVEHAPFAVWVCDPSGNIRLANRRASELRGWAGGGHANVRDDAGPDAEALHESLRSVVSGEVVRGKYVLPGSLPGTLRHIESTAFSVESSSRRVPSIVVIEDDVTEKHEAQEASIRRLANLEAVSRMSMAMRGVPTSDLPRIVLEESLRAVGASAGAIWLAESRDGGMVSLGAGWLSAIGERPTESDAETLASIASWDKPHICLDIDADCVLSAWLGSPAPPGWMAICQTLRARQEPVGLLVVAFESTRQPPPAEVDLLTTLTDIAGTALHRARLHDRTRLDAAALERAYDETLAGWALAMELRDQETEGHSRRVSSLTVELAQAMGIDALALTQIRRGALLHDIGKIGVPDSVLLKPGPLDPEEWVTMRRHPEFARELLLPIAFLRPALDIPCHHHERWDGSGYPNGLVGEQIPLFARIFAVVDVFDALTSDRPYRRAISAAAALAYVRERSGSEFDPEVVRHFVNLVRTSGWLTGARINPLPARGRDAEPFAVRKKQPAAMRD